MAHSPITSDSFSLVSVSSEEQIVWPLAAAPRRPWVEDSSSSGHSSDEDESGDEADDDDVSSNDGSSSGYSSLHMSSSLHSYSDLDTGSDDFVLLRHHQQPRSATRSARIRELTPSPSPSATEDELAPAFAELSLASHAAPPTTTVPPPSKRASRRQLQRCGAERRSATPSESGNERVVSPATAPPSKPSKRQRKKQRRRAKALAQANAVTKNAPSVPGGSVFFEAYEEAVRYINLFLSAPTPLTGDKRTQLTLLHAFIIELGLYTPPSPPSSPSSPPSPSLEPHSQQQRQKQQQQKQITALPTSLTAARATLKSSAFVNIREYLAARDQGPDALRAVMHPSRSALARSLSKQPANRMPVGKVKKAGLGVFLVNCYH